MGNDELQTYPALLRQTADHLRICGLVMSSLWPNFPEGLNKIAPQIALDIGTECIAL